MLYGMLILLQISKSYSMSNCTEYFQDSLSEARKLSNLKYSGKGINEVGQYESCIRNNWQYFSLETIEFSIPQIHLGLCLPTECSVSEVNGLLMQQGLIARELNEYSLSIGGIIFILIAFLILISTPIATFLHLSSKENLKYKFVKCFTAIETIQNLLKSRSDNKLASINGIKAISFGWVIYGHIFLFILQTSIINIESIGSVYKQ